MPLMLQSALVALAALAALQVTASKSELGPKVGDQFPAFEAPDQQGRTQSFETLRGPNGLLLLFYRSADW